MRTILCDHPTCHSYIELDHRAAELNDTAELARRGWRLIQPPLGTARHFCPAHLPRVPECGPTPAPNAVPPPPSDVAVPASG